MSNLPRHIAIVMDGNGRWAKQRGMMRVSGHKAGVDAVRDVITACAELGVEHLSLFAFSRENWKRPVTEVKALFELLLRSLSREIKQLHKNNIRIRFIGEHSNFDLKLQKQIQESEALTKNNTGLQLIIAINYGGRWDILQACQSIASKVKEGTLVPENIDIHCLHQAMSFSDIPDPDLFI